MRGLIAIYVIMTLMAGFASAQTITVRVLNGKSGKPMANVNITVVWSHEIRSLPENVLRTNDQGEGRIAVPEGEASFFLMPGPRDGKEPNRVAYINCNTNSDPAAKRNHGPAGLVIFPVKTVFEQGMVPFNDCGKKVVAPTPGVALFWGQPLSRWTPDMQ